jgi:DNA-binding FadR family transcriptional regulator
VRRGNVGGAVVHLPTPERTAQMISMVLQTRGTTPDEVSAALLYLEPVCAHMCASRPDRLTEVVPALRATVEAQQAHFDDLANWNHNARRFHETIVATCGNEPMIVVIGSLEVIWSAHESSVWNEAQPDGEGVSPDSPMATKTRRAALRDHEKLLAAIEAGNSERAAALSASHLTLTRRSTLASGHHGTIQASLVGGIDLSAVRQAVR